MYPFFLGKECKFADNSHKGTNTWVTAKAGPNLALHAPLGLGQLLDLDLFPVSFGPRVSW